MKIKTLVSMVHGKAKLAAPGDIIDIADAEEAQRLIERGFAIDPKAQQEQDPPAPPAEALPGANP